jgi:catechol 2,3-dioxygenase-like lactoylglutathione lyase family enzyme
MAKTGSATGIQQLWPLLTVQDIDRSIDFYTRLLGFTVVGEVTHEGRRFWARIERGGASLMLQPAEEDEDGPPEERGRGICFYFICDDVHEFHAELASRGLNVAPPKRAPYGMDQVFVPEPDGYSICFESVVPAAGQRVDQEEQ